MRVCWRGVAAHWVQAGTLDFVAPPAVPASLRLAGDAPDAVLPLVRFTESAAWRAVVAAGLDRTHL